MMETITREERKEKLLVWTKNGFYSCPKCDNRDIVHLTIAGEGEKFICKGCSYEEIIGEEFMKVRRGFSLESNIT